MIVIGASLGAARALPLILRGLPARLPVAVTVVLHRHRDSGGELLALLREGCPLPVEEAEDKTPLAPGRVFVAPPDYHLLVEEDHFALSADAPVSFARPSIDVLFESAADACGRACIGILLTGASADGAQGLATIRAAGGITIVQDPADAECPVMPAAALALGRPDHRCRAREIAAVLAGIFGV